MPERRRKDLTRRGFLTAAGGGLVTAGQLASGATPQGDRRENPALGQPISQTDRAQGGQTVVPGPPPQKLGYAIVGVGKFALGQVLPALAQSNRCRLAALVTWHPDNAGAVADYYGLDRRHIYFYEDYDKIRDDPTVDVVYVILPNSLHPEYTIRGAQAGKHVLCEKPMATTVEDCQAMIDACKRAARKLMIAYRVRYEPYNQTLIEWSRQQKYGPIQLIVADTLQDVGGPDQWRLDRKLAGGGSLVDVGIYSLNAARFLTGEEPTEINAMTYSDPKDPRFQQVEQSTAFQLRFPGGIMANCASSYSTATFNRCTVMAADGWYGLEPANLYTGQRLFHGHGNVSEELRLPHVDQVAAEMDHFSECILEDKEPLTPGEEGLRDVKLIQLIYEAARAGKTVKV